MYYNNGEDMKEVRYIVANRRKLLGGTAQELTDSCRFPGNDKKSAHFMNKM